MTDKKLTDSEIKEALEICGYHKECCYCNSVEECGSKRVLVANALDLINRLQAQNKDLAEAVHNLTLEKDALFDKSEELKSEVERLKEFIVETRRCDKEIKSEVVKEFAERLKEYATQGFWETDAYVGTEQIDNLLKEMVGEDK